MDFEQYVKSRRLFERLRLLVPAPAVNGTLERFRTEGSGYYVIFSGLAPADETPESAIQHYLILVDHEMGTSL